jgi:hypothetical protein
VKTIARFARLIAVLAPSRAGNATTAMRLGAPHTPDEAGS